jgi:predicted dehydrogenase
MQNISRRTFLGSMAAAGLATRAQADQQVGAAERINVALIGCGGMGRANLHDFVRIPEIQVVALCDVDASHLQDALADLRRAGRPTENVRLEGDFRRVLDRRDIDSVIVATPDHWHAYVFIAACAAGKDVYCEKPLSHNIVEGRAMVEAARRHRRVVQIGTQQRSGRHFQEAVTFVQSGRLGRILVSTSARNISHSYHVSHSKAVQRGSTVGSKNSVIRARPPLGSTPRTEAACIGWQ